MLAHYRRISRKLGKPPVPLIATCYKKNPMLTFSELGIINFYQLFASQSKLYRGYRIRKQE